MLIKFSHPANVNRFGLMCTGTMLGGACAVLTGVLVLPILLSPIQAQQQQNCGRLRQTQLYNQKEITEPDEHPWLGRVGYSLVNKSDTGEYSYRCLAVLLSERHAILPAHCILVDITMEASVILFGDWISNRDTQRRDCMAGGSCAPPPESYTILELAVHPQFDGMNYDNDIALAKLDRNVRFGEFVQPICLPPDHEVEGNHIGQCLEMVAFARDLSPGGKYRSKHQVHTLGSEYCKTLPGFDQFQATSNRICGLVSSEDILLSGAPLMGVNVVYGNPASYYLIAIINVGSTLKTGFGFPAMFMRIYPYREWIVRNMD
ncbi:phenoloxidase-activating factor 3-like [Drosophila subobscura]|uniref:phenoloxidase-activating factor 3-like n=1 Tax=Drosophila subobscura TaxID=7241 RepID=UPI00155AE83F|nr:phenoloxidase-activating factor 3-like [Drosophila subobscura]